MNRPAAAEAAASNAQPRMESDTSAASGGWLNRLGKSVMGGLNNSSNSKAAGKAGSAPPPSSNAGAQRLAPPAAARDGIAYGVHIVKRGDAVLGLQLDGNLKIREVRDGLVKEWNQANQHAEVCPGDQIVVVNGISGNVEAMFAAIKREPELRLRIHRYSSTSSSQEQSMPMSEEEQLQWAIRQSMEEAAAASAAGAVPAELPAKSVPSSQAPASVAAAAASASKAAASSNLEQKADGFMEATDVQKLLEAAEAREAQVTAERSELRQQLAENESLIKGLTDQLDMVNTQLREKTARNEELENALAKAQAAQKEFERTASSRRGLFSGATPAPRQAAQDQQLVDFTAQGDEEQQGVISQLLVRIQELEATLQQATHFAPVDKPAEFEEDSSAAAAAAATAAGITAAGASGAEAASEVQAGEAEAVANGADLAAAAAPAELQPEGEEVNEAAAAVEQVAETATGEVDPQPEELTPPESAEQVAEQADCNEGEGQPDSSTAEAVGESAAAEGEGQQEGYPPVTGDDAAGTVEAEVVVQ